MKKYRAIPKSRITASTGASYMNDLKLINLCEDMTYQVYDNCRNYYRYDPDFDMDEFIDDAVDHVIFVISELDQDNDPEERQYETFLPYVDDPNFITHVTQLCEQYNDSKLVQTRRA